MGSVRFGMVADALSQGLGLFAGKKADEEREKAEREWREALQATAERNSMNRETRQYARSDQLRAQDLEAATARQESQDARATERDRLTAESRAASLDQNATQFELERVDKAEAALAKKIENRYEAVQKQIEKAGLMDETAEERLMVEFGNYRDRQIEAHVIRLGKRNAPGYSIDDAGAFESKLIQLGMGPDAATFKTNELAPTLWPVKGSPQAGAGGVPYAPGQPEVGGEPLPPPPEELYAAPAPAVPGVSPGTPTAAAGSMPVNQVGVPPAGQDPQTMFQPPTSNVAPQPWGLKAADKVNTAFDWMQKQGSPAGR